MVLAFIVAARGLGEFNQLNRLLTCCLSFHWPPALEQHQPYCHLPKSVKMFAIVIRMLRAVVWLIVMLAATIMFATNRDQSELLLNTFGLDVFFEIDSILYVGLLPNAVKQAAKK